MKKLLSILAITFTLLCINVQSQAQDTPFNKLQLTCDLKLEGQASDLNLFHVVITDDESNNVTFDAKQAFSCELDINHSYTIIIKSNDHTARFLTIDTYGNITKRLTYHYTASLSKYRTSKDNIIIDNIEYDKTINQFCKK